MGRRNDGELSSVDEGAEDIAIRQLLARQGHPTFVAPPPDLAARVLANLPDTPPIHVVAAARRRSRLRRILIVLTLSVLLLSLGLGFWGVLGDSSGPAELLGGGTASLGRLILMLTLIAKPLVHILLAPGLPLLLLFIALIAIALWTWWRLAQQFTIGNQ
ncbi:MAG: hypothetical protein MI924_17900, partial [Chloroflexales bacterium]|nr:hypothetical protein [Chloroflexales bacterium]